MDLKLSPIRTDSSQQRVTGSSQSPDAHFIYSDLKEFNSHTIFFNTSNIKSGDELGNSPVSPTSGGIVPFTPQGDEVAAPVVNLVNIHESSKKYVVIGGYFELVNHHDFYHIFHVSNFTSSRLFLSKMISCHCLYISINVPLLRNIFYFSIF